MLSITLFQFYQSNFSSQLFEAAEVLLPKTAENQLSASILGTPECVVEFSSSPLNSNTIIKPIITPVEDVITSTSMCSQQTNPEVEKDLLSIETKHVDSQPLIERFIAPVESIVAPVAALHLTEKYFDPIKTVEIEPKIGTELIMPKTVPNEGSDKINSAFDKEECDLSGSESFEEVITSTSSQTDFEENGYGLPKGIFNDPDNDIVEDSPQVMDGKSIPRVLVPSDLWEEAVERDTWRETFYVPASMGGVLIGRFGK